MQKLYTIGFTKKTAEQFFSLLEKNRVVKVVDVRLNNTSQLAAFTKFPDIRFFLERILGVSYIQDRRLAPSEYILGRYKKKIIDWRMYEEEFFQLMNARDISRHIFEEYSRVDGYCLLCSEPTAEYCHRRLVAEKISEIVSDVEVIHL